MPLAEENITMTFAPAENNLVEVKDMIGKPPGWLLRSGIGMVGLVTIILITGTHFFKYPDKLTGKGVLTSDTPPIEIVSRSNGYIEQIKVQEGSFVNKDESILFINNTTDQTEIIQINNWIEGYLEIQDSKVYLD